MSNNSLAVMAERKQLNQHINSSRPRLDTFVNKLLVPSYEDGLIDAKTKHLIGLAVSIHTHCNDGIIYHSSEAVRLEIKEEVFMECIELCVLDGGSLIYPYARIAVKTYQELS